MRLKLRLVLRVLRARLGLRWTIGVGTELEFETSVCFEVEIEVEIEMECVVSLRLRFCVVFGMGINSGIYSEI